jgi:cobalamin biosynthetic protein CobC
MQFDYDNRDHGGRIDQAIATYGGDRSAWIDLSTGINPVPYPPPRMEPQSFTALPDTAATEAIIQAARRFWAVPHDAAILPVPGASIAIAQIPFLTAAGSVRLRTPSYNEHSAAFTAAGWSITDTDAAKARVLVHPNNPDGHWYTAHQAESPMTVIDESFCDVDPDRSLMDCATRPGVLILKSFGKFWGLAGLRLGFVIGDPDLVRKLALRLGPWAVSGPALAVGTAALNDPDWAIRTRAYLDADVTRLDRAVLARGGSYAGGTSLFRLYDHPRAKDLHEHLASRHIWTRTFPWSASAIRFGLPAPAQWDRLSAALGDFA